MRNILLSIAAGVALGLWNAQAENITIQGAGATFPAPLYAKWIEAFNKTHSGVSIDYQAIGSGGGIKGITDRTILFGGSDGPMTDEQLKAAPAAILHIPMVSGPEALIYNLPGIKELKLDGPAIAEIYLGKIAKWNDPKIKALNPGVEMPDKDILVAHRSDGSGTTWIFTNYLCKVSPEWKQKAGNATSVKWPVGLGGKGNAGVAQAVKNAEGGIGYVELAYAESSNMPFATQINQAGKAVRASIAGVIAAAAHSANEFPEDMRVSITNAPGDDSYPLAGFTYLLIYSDLSYLKDKNLATALLNYIQWCISDGQEMAESLKYARLPEVVQKKIEERLKTITFEGRPVLEQAH
jgi:phosphate transport system substrate-binding protein